MDNLASTPWDGLVTGIHLALSRTPLAQRAGSRGCCSLADASDARRAAGVLGIPYYVWDLSEEFTDTVVTDVVAEYAAGRTPNPDVLCNREVKFKHFLDAARELGAEKIATGHYARVGEAGGRWRLLRGMDRGRRTDFVEGTVNTINTKATFMYHTLR